MDFPREYISANSLWTAHAQPMDSSRTAHASPTDKSRTDQQPTDGPQNVRGESMGSSPTVCLNTCYGISIGLHIYGQSMDSLDSTRTVRGQSIFGQVVRHTDSSRTVHEQPTDSLPTACRQPMHSLGQSMDSPSIDREEIAYSPQAAHGQPAGIPRSVHGQPADSGFKAAHEHSADSTWMAHA